MSLDTKRAEIRKLQVCVQADMPMAVAATFATCTTMQQALQEDLQGLNQANLLDWASGLGS